MRAVLCKQFGPVESLVVEEVPDPLDRAVDAINDLAERRATGKVVVTR
ncbi:MAG: hypothetical protein ACLGIZ_10815 [Acidimicrobiia bacterium]